MPLDRRLQLESALVWSVLAVTSAVALHAFRLPPWVSVTYLLLLAWRILLAARGSGLPSRALRYVLVIAVVLGVLADFRTINGLDAGTAMLTLFAALKVLETRSVRDHVVLLLIAYFMVLAAFLHWQHLALLPLYATVVWLITMGLLRATQDRDTQTLRESARLAARVLLQASPLMLLMFVFFPRVPGPFWALPDASRAVSGLDDSMSPGDFSELSLQSTVAFRVRFEGPAPPPGQRYWRGPVLHDFDGYTWRREGYRAHLAARPQFAGATYKYSLMLEPSGRPWVYALDLPESWRERRLRQTFDYQLLANESVDQPVTLELSSRPSYRFAESLSLTLQRRDTRLPKGPNPRTTELAATLRERHRDDAQYVAAILQMFRDQEFFYTLTPPRLDLDSVDDFLFNTRSGFCGHFASAFTVLMREAGIPARVVTGYQGGEFNRFADYYIVRQSEAHAWSEVWLADRGWVRVDPTAAVAPERIERGLIDAVGADEPVADRFVRGAPWLAEIRFAWDALNTAWRKRVLEFNSRSQLALLEWLGLSEPDWRKLTVLLALSIVVVTALLALQLRRSMRGRRRDPVQECYLRFCRELEKRGIARNPHEGPLDFVRRVGAVRPELAAISAHIAELYMSLRYGAATAAATLDELQRSVRSFR